jgi:hypothetical protein
MTSTARSLRDRVDRLKGPGLRKVEPSSAKAHYQKRATLRLQLWAKGVPESTHELGRLMECNESAVRRAKAVGVGLPIPWWIEALIERKPEHALAYVESLLVDIESAMKRSGETR